MARTRLFVIAPLLVCFAAAWSAAQDEMWPGGTYDPKVPTPEQILGYKIGERHTPHYLVEKFIDKIAESSDRVLVRKIGASYQGRTQYSVVVSSPENLARLDEIRADIHKLADHTLPAAEAERIVTEAPAIVMLNYTIHGNEASGTEAGLRTLYQLAAGTDETTLRILEGLVTVINPVENPDGHDRYVNFINGFIVSDPNPNTDAMEHREPWPGGRSNAYYFDLNRDWVLLTQVETVDRIKEIVYWLPQVAPDLHEMGTNSTYFFSPPMPPINRIYPELIQKWWHIFGEANAAAFDRFGWGYYTQESFDEFYVGYGGSAPALLGCIPMTYEQASARGVVSERRDGTLLHLRDGAWHHFITSMSTLVTTLEKKEEKLRDFHQFYIEIVRRYREGAIKEIYLPPSDAMRVNKLVQRLQIYGAEVYRAKTAFTARGAYNYYTKKTEDVELPAGTVIVPLAQDAGAVVDAMLSPEHKLDEDFLKEERERIRRREEDRFYDVTGWSMPLTCGIPAYWGGAAAQVEREAVAAVNDIRPETQPVARAKMAYLIPPDRNANIALVGRLMAEDYRVRVSRYEFTLDGRKFPAGTAVLRVERNPEGLHARLNELIAETGGEAVAANTGLTSDGIDLGSNYIMAINKPKIAILGDEPISSSSFGALRYLFEQVYKLPYTPIGASSLARADLNKYNVLILPSMYGRGGGSLGGILGKPGIEELKRWVREGGVLICIEGAVDFAMSEDVKLTQAIKYKEKEKKPGEEAPPAGEKAAADKAKEAEKEKKPEAEKFEVDELLYTPGAILKVLLDDRSFLSWGYADGSAAVLVMSSDIYVPITEDQGMVAARFAAKDRMRLSGHVWPEMEELLAGKAYAWHEDFGRGQVICFADDPNFRASFDGLDRMFFNAVLFSLAYAP